MSDQWQALKQIPSLSSASAKVKCADVRSLPCPTAIAEETGHSTAPMGNVGYLHRELTAVSPNPHQPHGAYPSTLLPAHPMASHQYAYYTDYNATTGNVSSPPHSPAAVISPHLSPYASPGPSNANPYITQSPVMGVTAAGSAPGMPLHSPPTSPFYYYNQFIHTMDPHFAASLSGNMGSPGASSNSSLGSPRLAVSPGATGYPPFMMHGPRVAPMGSVLSPSSRGRRGSNARREGFGDKLHNTNVYINNLPPEMTDEELERLCSAFGTITSHKAIMDATTQTCKGFGFVMYETMEDTHRAIAKLTEAGFHASLARETFKNRLKNMQDKDSTNVYVTNLPLTFTEADLVNLFAEFNVVSPRILRNIDENNESRGVGFVRLSDRESAQRLIHAFHGQILPGAEAPLQMRFADTPAQKKLKRQSSRRRTPKPKDGEGGELPHASPRTATGRLGSPGKLPPVYYHGMPGAPHPGGMASAMFPPVYAAAPPPFPHFPMAPVFSGHPMGAPHYQPSIDQLTSVGQAMAASGTNRGHPSQASRDARQPSNDARVTDSQALSGGTPTASKLPGPTDTPQSLTGSDNLPGGSLPSSASLNHPPSSGLSAPAPGNSTDEQLSCMAEKQLAL
ncbi:hypothetical protein IWQ62_002437 [Dispira parvispora]|uniref:RRM domain-containing protein n=1 Tax=Dispira parvispora TaxID=1520584 RepID=A0A9W8AVP3_9FUNG|nr:hypothetical protein IWQ62_002437 [Dispira parvispora]